MHWICPECGFKNDEDVLTCNCGYQADDFVLSHTTEWETTEEIEDTGSSMFETFEPVEAETSPPAPKKKPLKLKAPEKPAPPKQVPEKPAPPKQVPEKPAPPKQVPEKPAPVKPGDEISIKESDSWKFTYSKSDKCIYAGTPALQLLRLKLTFDDLQELMEFMYEKTGAGKTTRRLQLSEAEVLKLVGSIEKIIDEKKSKVQIDFSDDELQQISAVINTMLKK